MPRVLGRRPGGADPPRPVVTTYEFKPEAGVKYSKVTASRTTSASRCRPSRSSSTAFQARPPSASRSRTATARPISLREMVESEALPALGVEADPHARQDDPRRAVRAGPRHDAAPAHRRLDRHRQVGRPQLDAHEHPLPRDARRRAHDHDRPQAPRAGDVRRDPAPADAGRRRPQEGVERAALGRPRDGGTLQDARGRRRPQHRAVQPQHPPRAAGSGPGEGSRNCPSRCRSSWW